MRRKDEPWFAEAVAAFQAGPGETDEQMAAQQQKLLPLLWADPARIETHQKNFAATSMSIEAWRGTEASRSDPFDLSAKLKQVKSPALIVVGDKDIVAPPLASRQIHLSLPNSKLLLLRIVGISPGASKRRSSTPRFPGFSRRSAFSHNNG